MNMHGPLEYLKQKRSLDRNKVALPKSAASLAAAIRKDRRLKRGTRLDRLKIAWREVVGDEIAALSEVRSYKGGEMRVVTSSHPIIHEYGSLRNAEIIQKLNEVLEAKDRVIGLVIKSGRIRS